MSDEILDDEEETWRLSEKGAMLALMAHKQITEQGWTIEQVAVYNDLEVDHIRVVLAMLYMVAERAGITLNDIPDTIEELT